MIVITANPLQNSFDTHYHHKTGDTQSQVANTLSCCRTTLKKYTRAGSAGLKFYRLQGVTPLTALNESLLDSSERLSLRASLGPAVIEFIYDVDTKKVITKKPHF